MDRSKFPSCALCRAPVSPDDARRLPFRCHNPADPLWGLNEATVHVDCLEATGIGRQWTRTLAHVSAGQKGWPPMCDACGARIRRPDELFGCVGFVSSDPAAPVYRFGGVCVHTSCVRDWRRRGEFAAALTRLEADLGERDRKEVAEFVAQLRQWIEFLASEGDATRAEGLR